MSKRDEWGDVLAQRQLLADCDVVLASTFAQAMAFNRRQALSFPEGLFGRAATTFAEWVAGLWEMHGDGRTRVDAVQRLALARRVVEECGLKHLEDTPNLAAALGTVASQGLGLPVFEEALAKAAAGQPVSYVDEAGASAFLTAAEAEVLALVAHYAAELEAAGFAEAGQMLAVLARRADQVFPQPVRVGVWGDAPLTCQQRFFFEACGGHVQFFRAQPVAGALPLGRVPADLTVRYAFPAGAYAQPQVVLNVIDEVRAHDANERIAVVGKDPLLLFEKLAGALTMRGITCAVRARTTFFATDFGKLYESMRAVMQGSDALWDCAALCDVLHSAYLNLPKWKVYEWDQRLRGDRLLCRSEVFAQMTAACTQQDEQAAVGRDEPGGIPDDVPGAPCADSKPDLFVPGMRELIALTADPWSVEVQEVFAARYRTLAHLPRSFVNEQLAAVQAFAHARDCVARAMRGGAREHLTDQLHGVLGNVTLSVSRANYEPAAGQIPQVRVCTQREAAQMESGEVGVLIACDLTAENYPLSDKLDAVQLLLERFGARNDEPALARERRTFAHMLAVPRRLLVLSRCLNDAAADPTYPCAMLEEFIDAYRDQKDLSDRTDLDNIYQLPPALQEGRYEAGEDALLQNVRPDATVSQLALRPQERWELGALLARAGEGSKPVVPSMPVAASAAVPIASTVPAAASGAVPIASAVPAAAATPIQGASSGTAPLASAVLADPYANPNPALPRVSPTQIDAYRDCPRSWLLQRRLGVDVPDEEADARAIGTFMHGLFQRFYEAFPQKVRAGANGNMAEAHETMFGRDGRGGVFGEWAAEQASREPGDRLALHEGTTETYLLKTLARRTREWLAFEAEFLPGFAPVAFEYRLQPTEYAGGVITGFVDRIDTDGKGNFVVVDYKGTILDSYSPLLIDRGKPVGFNPRQHVQALIYAAVLEKQGRLLLRMPNGTSAARTGACLDAVDPYGANSSASASACLSSGKRSGALSLEVLMREFGARPAPDAPGYAELPVGRVVGAVYVSYKLGNRTSGALNGCYVGASEVPHLARPAAHVLSSTGELGYSALLSYVEEAARDAIAGIGAFEADPLPADDGVCRYCPSVMCAERRG